MSRRPVFIRAAGAVTAAGVGLESLRSALADPSWTPRVGLERPDGSPVPVATCADFVAKEHLPMLVARRLGRPARLLAVAAREALAELGDPLPWEATRIGVTGGTSNAGTAAILEILKAVFLGNPDESPVAQFLNTVAHAPASQVSILEHLEGPNLTFAEKQVGGIRAAIEASRLFERSRADAVLACGVEEAQWITGEGYQRIGTLRRPGHAGQVLGEGATALVLAPEPGTAPLARLGGWASASSPAPPWCYPREADGLIRACREAMAAAGLGVAELDAVCTLSNGIPVLDRLELAMVRAVLGDHRPAVINLAPLGEGAFAGSLRILVAACAMVGRLEPRWPPPAHLAAVSMGQLVGRPRHVLVPGLAGGGSAIAVVVSAPS